MPGQAGRAIRSACPAALTLMAVTACAAPSGKPSGRWIGTLTPKSPGASCTASRGVLTIHDGTFTFVPDEGTWVLSGTASPDGTVTAERTRLGANKQPYVTRLTATWTEATVSGTYDTPGCSATVKLDRLS